MIWYYNLTMGQERVERLTIHPLFADVLSGEFRPPSDDQQRTHQLGRLAYAAYEKGDLATPSWRERTGRKKYVYTPSWASSVLAAAEIDYDFDSCQRQVFGLDLLSESDHRLTVHFVPSYSKAGVYLNDKHYPLELGPDLDEVKHTITEAAQEFFATVER